MTVISLNLNKLSLKTSDEIVKSCKPQLSKTDEEHRQELVDNINYFRDKARANNLKYLDQVH